MRKLVFVLMMIVAVSLFTAFAVAQTPGGTTGTNQTSQGTSATPDSTSNSSAPVTGAQTDPNTVNAHGNDMSAGEKTLDGCVVKEQSDYFIQQKDGDRERLAGTQDFSAHVGHEVMVHGSEQASMASNSSAASKDMSAPASSDRTSTSGSASTETQNNAAGSIAGNAGSSNATGTGATTSTSASSSWSGKDFMVTKVDMVSTSCPADIQKKVDENKSK